MQIAVMKMKTEIRTTKTTAIVVVAWMQIVNVARENVALTKSYATDVAHASVHATVIAVGEHFLMLLLKILMNTEQE